MTDSRQRYVVRMLKIESMSIIVRAGSLEEAAEIALPPRDDGEWMVDSVANEKGETLWLAG